MKFLLNYEKSLKSGLNLDYFFKIVIFYLYKTVIGSNFFYLIDKYLAEKFFFLINSLFNYFSIVFFTLKQLNFNQIVKISIILVIQILLICIL